MSSSPARIAAARANGAKSRGPKTPEGKLASSRNATTHGLTAQTLVLHNESQAQYESDLRAYLDHFRPQGKPETDLVHQLVAASWRLARYAAIETGLLENKMADQAEWLEEKYEHLDDRHRLAVAFESLTSNGSLALLNRYQPRLQREYQRLLKTLTDLQAARCTAEAKLSRQQSHRRRSEACNLAPSVVALKETELLPNEPKPFLETPAPEASPANHPAPLAPLPPASGLEFPRNIIQPYGPDDGSLAAIPPLHSSSDSIRNFAYPGSATRARIGN
jgi:hypothetical protein